MTEATTARTAEMLRVQRALDAAPKAVQARVQELEAATLDAEQGVLYLCDKKEVKLRSDALK